MIVYNDRQNAIQSVIQYYNLGILTADELDAIANILRVGITYNSNGSAQIITK